ncbi:unnamed protein product [Somion occarium]|uniref:Zn(2)-C6 fungal-type domain-containing protein n=1 Tax=Somion occarium TaxID=3059160 RepID=A0ABP1CVS2_9APHY
MSSSNQDQNAFYYEWDSGAQLLESDPNSSKTPRRVPMACTFCRKRKLKCDGRKTSCANCERRGIPCSYVPVAEDNR